MYCHNITKITKFQINILNIEYIFTNSNLLVGNWILSPIGDILHYYLFVHYYL